MTFQIVCAYTNPITIVHFFIITYHITYITYITKYRPEGFSPGAPVSFSCSAHMYSYYYTIFIFTYNTLTYKILQISIMDAQNIAMETDNKVESSGNWGRFNSVV